MQVRGRPRLENITSSTKKRLYLLAPCIYKQYQSTYCKYACTHFSSLTLLVPVGQVYAVVTYPSTNSLDISFTVEKIHNSHQISCFTGSKQLIILQENINHSNHSHHYTFSHSDLFTGSPENHLITCSCRCTHYRFTSKFHFISFLHTFPYRDVQCTLKYRR